MNQTCKILENNLKQQINDKKVEQIPRDYTACKTLRTLNAQVDPKPCFYGPNVKLDLMVHDALITQQNSKHVRSQLRHNFVGISQQVFTIDTQTLLLSFSRPSALQDTSALLHFHLLVWLLSTPRLYQHISPVFFLTKPVCCVFFVNAASKNKIFSFSLVIKRHFLCCSGASSTVFRCEAAPLRKFSAIAFAQDFSLYRLCVYL